MLLIWLQRNTYCLLKNKYINSEEVYELEVLRRSHDDILFSDGLKPFCFSTNWTPIKLFVNVTLVKKQNHYQKGSFITILSFWESSERIFLMSFLSVCTKKCEWICTEKKRFIHREDQYKPLTMSQGSHLKISWLTKERGFEGRTFFSSMSISNEYCVMSYWFY